MAQKTVLVLHRKSANEPRVKEAVKAVQGEGVKLRVLVPWNKSEKPKIVRQAIMDGATRIIAGGGDGTVNAVVNAMVGDGKKRPQASLGVLPLGTANDFARGCGLPVDDLAECLRIACSRRARPMDVGRMNKRNFINVASGGFGAEITATTPVEMKKKLGGAAYTIMGLLKVFKLSPYTGTLLVPGDEPERGEMLFMAVGNNRYAGGGFEVASQAAVDDGLLDLATIRHGPKFSLSNLAAELENPMNPANTMIQYRQLSAFTIEADEKLHINLDGEPVLKSRLKFSTLRRHLGVAY